MIRNILVSQPQPATPKNPYAEMTKKYGVNFTFRPFIKVESLSVHEFRKQRVDVLKHTAIVFTSRHAIDSFFAIVQAMRVKMPETMKYFATSESIALYIQKFVQYRKRKVFFGTTGKVDDLVPVMAKHKTEKYLVPQNDTTDGNFLKMLDAKSLKYTHCVMYRTVSVPISEDELKSQDMVVLFTAAGVDTLVTSFPGFEQGMLRVATLGNAARIAAEGKGLRIDVVAPLPKQPSITGAIADYLEEESEHDTQAALHPETLNEHEQEQKLRRSVAAKKGLETKRRKQMLNEELQQHLQDVEMHRAHAEDVRRRSEEQKRLLETLKRDLEKAQAAYDEARRQADRITREGEKARREMREAKARSEVAVAELASIEEQIAKRRSPAQAAATQTTTKAKTTTATKATKSTTKATATKTAAKSSTKTKAATATKKATTARKTTTTKSAAKKTASAAKKTATAKKA
ncbi:MAG: uroporphyrinogen-III synthase [Bacteroidaceae bacterium]|nr:uroporphyrinogen-III synthase [Bacteroidaceae bacterium]